MGCRSRCGQRQPGRSKFIAAIAPSSGAPLYRDALQLDESFGVSRGRDYRGGAAVLEADSMTSKALAAASQPVRDPARRRAIAATRALAA
jgi:hypothetical protein